MTLKGVAYTVSNPTDNYKVRKWQLKDRLGENQSNDIFGPGHLDLQQWLDNSTTLYNYNKYQTNNFEVQLGIVGNVQSNDTVG